MASKIVRCSLNDDDILYQQVLLTKGNLSQTVWIPARFAMRNMILRLRQPNSKIWSGHWKVTEAYGVKRGRQLSGHSIKFKSREATVKV